MTDLYHLGRTVLWTGTAGAIRWERLTARPVLACTPHQAQLVPGLGLAGESM